jgi:crotonobetainyl-CoA:carnitine CoA-transferase CaiB-like acyl-CoA transferase
VLANGYVVDVDHPKFGRMPVIGVPVGLSETPGRAGDCAPECGQHTEEILTELLGYTWDQVSELRAKKVT